MPTMRGLSAGAFFSPRSKKHPLAPCGSGNEGRERVVWAHKMCGPCPTNARWLRQAAPLTGLCWGAPCLGCYSRTHLRLFKQGPTCRRQGLQRPDIFRRSLQCSFVGDGKRKNGQGRDSGDGGTISRTHGKPLAGWHAPKG